MTATPAPLIAAHGLVPHPEGGHYRETFRSPPERRVLRLGSDVRFPGHEDLIRSLTRD